ncbi:MAG TPA: hypothetical protein VHC69_18135 [Polyangiaceae bacterium]|nr:hypothetical protein [Polyangiaceae bacterium]
MRKMVFENVLRAAAVGGLCVACASTPGTSGETHFLCAKTADCTPHASDLVCVEGECRHQPEVDTGTPVATKIATPDAARNDGSAQGAVTLEVTPTEGNKCKYTNGPLGVLVRELHAVRDGDGEREASVAFTIALPLICVLRCRAQIPCGPLELE